MSHELSIYCNQHGHSDGIHLARTPSLESHINNTKGYQHAACIKGRLHFAVFNCMVLLVIFQLTAFNTLFFRGPCFGAKMLRRCHLDHQFSGHYPQRGVSCDTAMRPSLQPKNRPIDWFRVHGSPDQRWSGHPAFQKPAPSACNSSWIHRD